MQQKTRPVTPSPLLTIAEFVAVMQPIYDSLLQEIRALDRGAIPLAELTEEIQKLLPATIASHSPTDHTIEEILTRLGRVEGLLLGYRKELDILHHAIEKVTPPQNSTPEKVTPVPFSQKRDTPTPSKSVPFSQKRDTPTPSKSVPFSQIRGQATPPPQVSVGVSPNRKKGTVKGDSKQRVVAYVKSHPGASLRDIEKATGVAKSYVGRILKEEV